MVTSRFTDHTGEKFTRWIVLSFAEQRGGMRLWNCICECGTKRQVAYNNLYMGKSRSCGCLQAEIASRTHFKHDQTKHPIYHSWAGAKNRCYNKNDQNFHYYGGRGIKVCERWIVDFWNFWDDMASGWRPGLTIERVNVNGNYEPENCCWATQAEQMQNTRTTRIIDTPWGNLSIPEAARRIGISKTALEVRIKNNWPSDLVFDATHRTKWGRKPKR